MIKRTRAPESARLKAVARAAIPPPTIATSVEVEGEEETVELPEADEVGGVRGDEVGKGKDS